MGFSYSKLSLSDPNPGFVHAAIYTQCEFFRCLIACGVTMEYNVGICWIIFGGQVERQVGSMLTQNTKKEAVDECNQCNPAFLNSSVWELF